MPNQSFVSKLLELLKSSRVVLIFSLFLSLEMMPTYEKFNSIQGLLYGEIMKQRKITLQHANDQPGSNPGPPYDYNNTEHNNIKRPGVKPGPPYND